MTGRDGFENQSNRGAERGVYSLSLMRQRLLNLLALICLPVLLVCTVGAGSPAHPHPGDGCTPAPSSDVDLPDGADKQSCERGLLTAGAEDSDCGHEHCCVCVGCHDQPVNPTVITRQDLSRGKGVGPAQAVALLRYEPVLRPLSAWPTPLLDRPASDPILQLRTVVLLT